MTDAERDLEKPDSRLTDERLEEFAVAAVRNIAAVIAELNQKSGNPRVQFPGTITILNGWRVGRTFDFTKLYEKTGSAQKEEAEL